MAIGAEKQAEVMKKKGNEYFKKEKLNAAMEAYTEAITLCPKVPVYWTNRALCARKRNEWEKVEADCLKALELDSKSTKGHYLLGLALLNHQQYARAIQELEKALDLARGGKIGTGSYMVEEIWQELSKARYTEWQDEADLRSQQQLHLKRELEKLMKEDKERKLADITSVLSKSNPPPGQAPQDLNSPEGQTSVPSNQSEGNRDGAPYTSQKPVAGGNLYPPIFGETDGSDPEPHRHESTRENNSNFDEENLTRPSTFSSATENRNGSREVPVDKPDSTSGSSARFNPLNNRFSFHRRKSLQRKLQAFLDSEKEGAVEQTDEGTNVCTIKDVYKVFKELVRLQQQEAGRKLLRTVELHERQMKVLNDVFERVAAPDRPAETPDHLCCKITMEIFRDPVITPSGVTYERAAIEEHLKKVGGFDPFTRTPLTIDQVYPNLSLRDSVQTFLQEHGWAYRG